MCSLISTEKNIVANEIQDIQKRIEYHERRINNISISNMDEKYVNNAIEKSQEAIEKLRDEKLMKMKRYSDISEGLLDDEIMDSYRKRTVDIDAVGDIKINLKKQIQKDLDKKLQLSRKIERDARAIENKYKYSIDNELNKMHRISDGIPDYVTKELNDMPNNHGYIWKGVHFYGKKPDDNCEYMMKEPMKGFCNVYIQDRNEEGYPVGDKYHYKLVKGKLIPVDVNGIPNENRTTDMPINPGGPLSVQERHKVTVLTQKEKRIRAIRDMKAKRKKKINPKTQPDWEMPETYPSSTDIVDRIKRETADPVHVTDGIWQNDTSL